MISRRGFVASVATVAAAMASGVSMAAEAVKRRIRKRVWEFSGKGVTLLKNGNIHMEPGAHVLIRVRDVDCEDIESSLAQSQSWAFPDGAIFKTYAIPDGVVSVNAHTDDGGILVEARFIDDSGWGGA